MENNNNVKEGCGGEATKNNDENPNSTTLVVVVEADENLPQPQPQPQQPPTTRTPFTSLSQVDADLALARTLQEQERAYLMLSMNGGEMSDYGSSGTGSYVDEDDDDDDDDDDDEEDVDGEEEEGENDDGIDGEEDAFDVHAHGDETDDDDDEDQIDEPDPSAFTSDEAYARALQDAEDREMAMRLMALAGINDFGGGDHDSGEDHESNSQDTWEEVDPDEMSYEELLALGEAVGTQSRGLSSDTIATLPSISYKAQDNQDGNDDPCVICRLEYEEGETLTVLSCKHSYHSECINNWLQINKVCPVCSTEVSTSESSR